MFTKEEIFEKLKEILVRDFEINSEDLELDSIDAVDLAVKVQQFTNKKMTPEDFKQIKTLEDVVQRISELICK